MKFRNQEIFIISLFSIVQIWVLKVKFFCSFWLIFCPLDPDPDPGNQNLADPDPKHWLKIMVEGYRCELEDPLENFFDSPFKLSFSGSSVFRLGVITSTRLVEPGTIRVNGQTSTVWF